MTCNPTVDACWTPARHADTATAIPRQHLTECARLVTAGLLCVWEAGVLEGPRESSIGVAAEAVQ